jgi:ferric-dicitrate binding protein FerR (iron transport regulator)
MSRVPTSPIDDRAADDALRALVEQPVAPLAPEDADAMRARVLARVEARRVEALGARGRGDWRTPWLVFAAAASLPVLVWGSLRIVGSRAQHAGIATVTVLRGHPAIERDAVTTGARDEARAELPTGAVVEVAASSSARFIQGEPGAGGELVELGAGHIQVSVPKLGSAGSFRVHTGQATVVVHGTRFVVEASLGVTRVSVVEGVVEVDAPDEARLLTAGMSFVVSDATKEGGARSASGDAQELPGAWPAVAPGASARADKGSTLASENVLLADAMRLRHDRQDDRSLAKLDDLLARHAGSPLAETARVERIRVLGDLGNRDRLVREAQSYLDDYPAGFARTEVSHALAVARGAQP